jgi:hypothetical protein
MRALTISIKSFLFIGIVINPSVKVDAIGIVQLPLLNLFQFKKQTSQNKFKNKIKISKQNISKVTRCKGKIKENKEKINLKTTFWNNLGVGHDHGQ